MSWQESSASNPDRDGHVMKQFHTRVMPLKVAHVSRSEGLCIGYVDGHGMHQVVPDHSELLEFEGTERLILLTRNAPAC